MALNVGDRLGHYDVTALIGEGDMTDKLEGKTDPEQTVPDIGDPAP